MWKYRNLERNLSPSLNLYFSLYLCLSLAEARSMPLSLSVFFLSFISPSSPHNENKDKWNTALFLPYFIHFAVQCGAYTLAASTRISLRSRSGTGRSVSAGRGGGGEVALGPRGRGRGGGVLAPSAPVLSAQVGLKNLVSRENRLCDKKERWKFSHFNYSLIIFFLYWT